MSRNCFSYDTLILLLAFIICDCTRQETASWCAKPLRPELSLYTEVETGQSWFKVYQTGDGVFAIVEPYNYQEVISYLIVGSKRNILFDTGMGMGRISEVVKRISTLPVVVINSHTHYDHIGGNHEFDTVYAVDTAYAHHHASSGWAHTAVSYEVTPKAFCAERLPELDTGNYTIKPYHDKINRYLRDGDTLQLGDRILEVMLVPGHTPDCVALLDHQNGYLWTGDMYYEAHIWLFMDGTDLDAYAKSIERFANLAPELQRVFPAHNKPVSLPSHLLDLKAAFDSIRSGIKTEDSSFQSGYPEDTSAVQFTFRDFSFLIRRELLGR